MNRITFLSRDSLITKGFSFAILIMYDGMLSIGKIRPERRRSTLDTETDARVAVSSEENKYPIQSPIRMKSMVIRVMIISAVKSVAMIWWVKKITVIRSMMASCRSMISSAVSIIDKKKVKSLVGEIKFLKWAFDSFSMIINVAASSMETNIIIMTIRLGKR